MVWADMCNAPASLAQNVMKYFFTCPVLTCLVMGLLRALWNIAKVRWQLYQSLTSLDPAVSLICRPQLKPRLAFSCGVWSRGAAREWIIFCVWLRRLQRLPSRGPAAAAKKTAIHLAGNSVTALRRAALRVTPHTGIQMETRSRVCSLYCPVVYLSTPRP